MVIKSKRNNEYFYDNSSGQILHIPEGMSSLEIEKRYDDVVNMNKKQVIKVTEKNLLDYLYKDGNGFKQLILEVTTGCNLRCKYCIYSDHYPNTRTHGKMVMDFQIAKKAIDFYFKNYQTVLLRNPMKKPIISFYGGEPLLHFHRLKEIVNYINLTYGEYDITYNITTNGLLFNSEAQEFLTENNFSILISLDGYKENHDRNRVDINDNGSFDKIVEHVRMFIKNYPEASASISTCFDFKTNLVQLSEFFNEFPLLVTNIAQVQVSNGNYYSQFSNEDSKNMVASYEAVKKQFFEGIETGNIDKTSFLYRYFGSIYGDFAYHPMAMEYQPDIKPYTGACIPGEKLYVTVDGTFKICEKINSSYTIGNVDQGLDTKNIAKIMNDYNSVLKDRCSKCTVSRLCKLCYKEFDTSEGFSDSLDICENQRNKLNNMLVDYVNLMEVRPQLFEDITGAYYSLLSEVGELA